MKTVLVTGSAGFIGHHLAQLLHSIGLKVVGLDEINDYYDANLKIDRLKLQNVDTDKIEYGKVVKGDIDFVKLHLQDDQAVMDLFAIYRFDYVVNLAAQAGVRYSLENPKAYLDSNVYGFLSILEACRAYPVEHLVYASTSSVYGLNENLPFKTSSTTDHPMALYAATKKSNELMAHSYSHLFKIPSTGLRFFTVYGPWGRPDMALFLFTDAIMRDEAINIFGNGEMMRDFTYVTDIVTAISKLLPKHPSSRPDFDAKNPTTDKSSAPYSIYNIGNNDPVGLMEYVEAIELALGKEAKKNFMGMQPGDVKATYADVETLYSYIGFKPATSVKEGVANFVNWYKEYYSK